MTQPINRIKHILQTVTEQQGSMNSPSLDPEKLKRGFQALKEEVSEDRLDFGHDDGDDDDDNNHDRGDDDDDETYLNDKLNVANDPEAIITEARVIFQKDPKTGKVFLTARLDEMDLPDYFSPDGDEMFKSDIIIRIFGKAFANPRKVNDPIDGCVFKKKNWQDKI